MSDLAAELPLARRRLLAAAVGRRLDEIERQLIEPADEFSEPDRQQDDWFAAASGPVQLRFGPVIHSLTTWPSALSLIVDGDPLPDDPFAPRYQLSRTGPAPDWLRACLGRTVADVLVHVYREEGVESPEPRQAAVSYRFEEGGEMLYGIYVHGRLDGDELFPPEAVNGDLIERSLSVLG